mgnify:CR=1 FL=1
MGVRAMSFAGSAAGAGSGVKTGSGAAWGSDVKTGSGADGSGADGSGVGTSGAAGSETDASTSPLRRVTSGFGCRLGVGNPCAMSDSNSSVPTPLTVVTGTTGNSRAVAVAFMRSCTRYSRVGSSPPR